jgi:hypothetical protein
VEHTEQIEETQLAFSQVIRREKRRLQNGYAMREYIGQQLRAGNSPDHYRVHWIEQGIDRVIGVLGDMSNEFNEANPNDKISAHDFVDVLKSTINTIAHRAGLLAKSG